LPRGERPYPQLRRKQLSIWLNAQQSLRGRRRDWHLDNDRLWRLGRAELVAERAKRARDDASGGEGRDDDLPRLKAQQPALILGVGPLVVDAGLQQLDP
jgi:hypothetical protein